MIFKGQRRWLFHTRILSDVKLLTKAQQQPYLHLVIKVWGMTYAMCMNACCQSVRCMFAWMCIHPCSLEWYSWSSKQGASVDPPNQPCLVPTLVLRPISLTCVACGHYAQLSDTLYLVCPVRIVLIINELHTLHMHVHPDRRNKKWVI